MVRAAPSRIRLAIAFAVIYVVWGSTYLAIRYGVETLPPFLLAGSRFTLAGLLLGGWALYRGAPRPSLREVRSAAIVGTLLMVTGNGLVTWGEQYVPSGIAALIITTVPLWMILLDRPFFGGPRPSRASLVGLAVGFAGVVVLSGVGDSGGTGATNTVVDTITEGVTPTGHAGPAATIPVLGAIGLLVASASWAVGSLYSRRAQLPRSVFLATGLEMLCGGIVLMIVGTLGGEWKRFEPDTVALRSVLSWVYLVIFGSIVGLTAYGWLLREASAAAVSTYAFVNPVVALLLGALFAGEVITGRVLISAALIVGAVVLIRSAHRPSTRTPNAVLSQATSATTVPNARRLQTRRILSRITRAARRQLGRVA